MGKFQFFRNAVVMTFACLLYHISWVSFDMGTACNDRVVEGFNEISMDAILNASSRKSMPVPASTGNGTTIVSAYYPMDSKHSSTKYNTWMRNFFAMTDLMVVFTSSAFYPTVKSIIESQNATDRVELITLELNATDTSLMFDTSVWEKQYQMDPEKHRYKSYEVRHTLAYSNTTCTRRLVQCLTPFSPTTAHIQIYWVWLAKPEFIRRAVALNPHQSNFFAWVDIGYFRVAKWAGHKMLNKIPPNLAMDQTLMLDVNFGAHETHLSKPDPMALTVGGGFIGGYIPAIYRWNRLFFGLLRQRQHEFFGKDQPYMYRTCFVEEKTCLLVKTGKETFGDPWFFMAPFMIMGERASHARTWVPSVDTIGQPYDKIVEPPVDER